jgi:hypothetical protein
MDEKAVVRISQELAPYLVDSETLEIDHVAEKKLVRKLDMHIVPMVMLAYLLCFVDRVNIGNARLYGLEKDLGLYGNQYQTAVSLLFATYVTSELPSNLVLKKFTPSRWFATITFLWGVVATLTGVVQNFAGLIACRLALGLIEGGLFPGLTVYLTLFYTKREMALRVGYLFVSAALSGACGGLLAYCIGFMDGVAGQKGWRWIFIIEGNPPTPSAPSSQLHHSLNNSRHPNRPLRRRNLVPPRQRPRNSVVPIPQRKEVNGNPPATPIRAHRIRPPLPPRRLQTRLEGLENLDVRLWPIRLHRHALRLLCLPANHHQRYPIPIPSTLQIHPPNPHPI